MIPQKNAEIPVGNRATSDVAGSDVGQPDPNAALKILTPREREYVLQLALGKSRAAIATAMDITTSCAGYYHSVTARKLGVEACKFAAYAILQGWRS